MSNVHKGLGASQKRFCSLALSVVAVFALNSAQASEPTTIKSRPSAKSIKYEPIREVQSSSIEPSWPPIWQGFYAGVSVGVGRGDSTHVYNRNDNHGDAEQSLTGALGSITFGYNYMLSPSWVAGVEGDIGVMDLSASDKVIFDGHVWKAQFGPAWGTLRGRLGYVYGRSLLYGTAGLAFMSVDEVGFGDAAGQTAINQSTRTGFVVGAGVEHALSERLTAKVEFLHMDFGTYDGLSENRETYSFTNSVNILRTGVNMRF